MRENLNVNYEKSAFWRKIIGKLIKRDTCISITWKIFFPKLFVYGVLVVCVCVYIYVIFRKYNIFPTKYTPSSVCNVTWNKKNMFFVWTCIQKQHDFLDNPISPSCQLGGWWFHKHTFTYAHTHPQKQKDIFVVKHWKYMKLIAYLLILSETPQYRT